MKTTVLCLLLACAGTAISQDSVTLQGHTQWVGTSLLRMQSVKPGMTRGALQKIFLPDGGLSTRTRQTFVYRECPYFKVDVEFTPSPLATGINEPRDEIKTISQPYLAQPTAD